MAFDGRASVMTQNRQAVMHEVNELHLKTFGAWVNFHLQKVERRADDPINDFRDGTLLIKLAESLLNQPCPHRYNNAPSNDYQRVDNVVIALKFLAPTVQLSDIDPKAIVNGSVKDILALIWRLIITFQAFRKTDGGQQTSDMSDLRRKLLEFVRARTTPYGLNVVDFGKSWGDGMAFCALVDSICPGLLNYSQLTPARPFDNMRLAFMAAAEYLQVPPILDPADMCDPNPQRRPDERCVMAYLLPFVEAMLARGETYNNNPPQPQQPPQPQPQPQPILPPQPTPPPPQPTPPPQPFPPPQSFSQQPPSSSSSSHNFDFSQFPQPDGGGVGGMGGDDGSSSKNSIGVLHITLFEARGLLSTDMFSSTANPYAFITLDRQKEKTRKCKGTLNPIWEQSFQMFISPNSEFLMIEVFDQTRLLSDDFMGKVEILIKDLKPNEISDKWYPLKAKTFGGRMGGEIHMKLCARY